jgi:methionyl aminopeptidase
MLDADSLAKLRKAGEVAAAARDKGMSMVKPGARLHDVAQEVEGYIRGRGCGLAFPCNIGVNSIAAHYTPPTGDTAVFQTGDVVKIDCGAELDGFVGDTAGTVEAGTRNRKALIESSRRARDSVAEFIGAGVTTGEIGRVVCACIGEEGFLPIRNLCGHQIKQYDLHAGLSIPNFDDGSVNRLEAGTTVAVEPFATNGSGIVRNGPPGNIVRIARDRPLADPRAQEFLEYAKREFKTFPFCARSCDFKGAEEHVATLVRHGVLYRYAQLIDSKGGIVSQHEHTFYIAGDRAEVTTLP